MVSLAVSGTDKYGNPTDISGAGVWQSSDPAIIVVRQNKSANPQECLAIAVGPVGAASVVYTNDANWDGSGDFIGSISFEVTGGQMSEITITAGEPESKPGGGQPEPPPVEGGGETPDSGAHPDNTLPNERPVTGEPPVVDPRTGQPRR
jgi:hypothetical protein